MATSYNGWIAVKDGSGIDRSFTAVGATFPGGVKAGSVATVFRWLIQKLNTIEPVVPGWCWGYEYRANVNNPSTLSCHSSGTAIDYNAPNHPNGARGTWSSAQVSAIRGFLAQLDGVVRWGYDFTGTKDEMHFEIIGSQADVDRVAASLGDPGKPGTPVEEDDMPYSEADLERIIGKVIDSKIDAIGDRVWRQQIKESSLQPPWAIMMEARKAAQDAAAKAAAIIADMPADVVSQRIKEYGNRTVWDLLGVASGVARTPTDPPPAAPTYTVVAGDTLGAIAKKFGVTVDDLVSWNGIADPNNISVGQVLKVGKA